MDLSFSGAGFMGCYYFGVVDCWKKYIPRERVNRVAGASAGSLIAAYYLLDLPLNECLRQVITMTEDIRRRPLGVFDRSNQIVDVLPRLLDRLFPDDAHKQVGNRLHVCMTRLKDMKKVMINEFETKKDLIDALNCSCFIPLWSGNHVSTYKGVKHIDGGFTDNLPTFDEHTIRVCCFAGASDISPLDGINAAALNNVVILNTPLYINLANLRRARRALSPASASFILDLLEQGFHDTKDFILSNDLIQCDACYRSNAANFRLAPSPTITPGASPALSRAGSARRASGPSLPTDASLERQLRAKLALAALAEAEAEAEVHLEHEEHCKDAGRDQNNNCPAQCPSIVVEDTGAGSSRSSSGFSETDSSGAKSSAASSSLESEQEPEAKSKCRARRRPEQVLSERFLRRRSTLAEATDGSALLAADRFRLAPVPLPSCPPSPSLNRDCGQCLRLRTEARNDLLEETIRRSAATFVAAGARPAHKRSRLADKLASPIRWIRNLGMTTSYDLELLPAAAAAAAAAGSH